MNKEEFNKLLKHINIQVNDKQYDDFKTYYSFLVQENDKYNLTAILKEDEVYEKHFYDSLSLLDSFKFSKDMKVIDVGSGAGFPSLPLKIIDNDIDLTILDSNNKKIYFNQELAKTLNINNSYINARAEEVKDQFDVVLARGVARLVILLELCCNLVKKDGYIICMKGSNYQEEINEASICIKELGYELVDKYEYKLINEQSLHCNLIFKKVRDHLDKYPRNYGTMKKKPIGTN